MENYQFTQFMKYSRQGDGRVRGFDRLKRRRALPENKPNPFKFYRSKKNPTISMDRTWAEEAEEIDALLRKNCGSSATWSRIFAYGDIANNIYYLFKRGHHKFKFSKISFRYVAKNIYTVILEEKVIVDSDNTELT